MKSGKGSMAKKRRRTMTQGGERKVKIDNKMKKLFQKRATEYNSDEEGEDAPRQKSSLASGVNKFKKTEYNAGSGRNKFKKTEYNTGSERNKFKKTEYDAASGFSDDGEEDNHGMETEVVLSDDEDGAIQPGVMKFTEGIKAFRVAFKNIVRKTSNDENVLGPVLSAHKKLLAEKLAEEESENKVKGEVKKEKNLICERGHMKPENYLDAHEKFLLGVATKGVVKLFNAVNRAQNAQKGLDPSRSKDEKAIKKQRKEAFFSELGRTSSLSSGTGLKVGASSHSGDGEAPPWAPLRDNYMLTNPKLKDWDKMQDADSPHNLGGRPDTDSSSDDD